MDCIFCKIVSGQIPSFKVFEDETALAFLDIAPVAPGHTLVIPKKHYANFEEIPGDELCKLILAVKKIGGAIKTGLGIKGYTVSENNDPVAGQVIPHIHFHIMPRSEGDGLELWPQGRYGAGEAENCLKKIVSVF
jgi:histidine triad (HIT) family protein